MELSSTQANEIIASDLQNNFYKFVSFLDRGEKTTRTYLINLKQFAKWLHANNITQPTRADIIAYRDYLAQNCKPNTTKQYLQSVRAFYRWTAAELIYPNIAENIHAPKVRQDAHKKDALNAQEVLRIERSIADHAEQKAKRAAEHKKDTAGRIDRATEQGKRLFAMYLLAVNCGLRTIELHRANIKDIETKNGKSYIYIWGKGHSEADTKKTLAPAVKDAIDDYLSSRTDSKHSNSPLFVSTGNRSNGKRIATTTISTMLKKAMVEAGFDSERLTAHSLRHTAGTSVQEITNNLYLTQQYMRHANPATTEIYLHNKTERQEEETATKLYNYYHGLNDQSDNKNIESIIAALTAEQLRQLAGVALAIAK